MNPNQPSRNLRAELAPILVGHVCLHACMTGARMAAPLFALSLGYGATAAGVLVGLFAITQIFLSLPAGRYADRNGLKRPMGLSVIVTAAGVGLAAIWPIFPVLCLTAVMCGGAVGVASIALQRHVGRMAENPIELKQVFSWLSIAPAFSNFLGPFSAGVMIDHGGFQAAFALLASFPIIAWLLLRNARELPNEDVRPRSSAAAWDLVRDKDIRRLLLMNWFMNASWDMHSFMIPVLGHERGLPATVIGGILGAFAVSAALIRVVLPLFAHRVKEWALITGATAVAGVLFLLYPFATSAWAMGLCSAALGTVLGTIQPMVMSMLHQITPRDRHGEALAVRMIMVNISSVSMPLMFGIGGGLLGASGVFWAMGLIVGLGSRLGLGLRGMEARRAEH